MRTIGYKIHVVVNNRFKVPEAVVSTQKILIEYYDDHDLFRLKIDGIVMYDAGKLKNKWSADELDQFCQNNGFPSSDEFFEFFNNESFEGKIIHYTDKKY